MGISDLRAEIRETTSQPVLALNTHFHWDHTGANTQFDKIAMNEIEIELYATEPNMSAYRSAMQAPNTCSPTTVRSLLSVIVLTGSRGE